MDERFVVHLCLLVVVVRTHRFKCSHLQAEHTQGEDVGFGGQIGIIYVVFELLDEYESTLSIYGER